MLIALTTSCMHRVWGGGEGSVEKEGARVNQLVIITNIYNLFRVSLFHSDETFHVYACTRSVFSNIKACNVWS